jgi:hypothetical protein
MHTVCEHTLDSRTDLGKHHNTNCPCPCSAHYPYPFNVRVQAQGRVCAVRVVQCRPGWLDSQITIQGALKRKHQPCFLQLFILLHCNHYAAEYGLFRVDNFTVLHICSVTVDIVPVRLRLWSRHCTAMSSQLTRFYSAWLRS